MHSKIACASNDRILIAAFILLVLAMGNPVQLFSQSCDRVDQIPAQKSKAHCTLSGPFRTEELPPKKNTDCASRLIVLQLNTLDNLIWETAPLHKPGNHESAYSSIPILLMKESFLI